MKSGEIMVAMVKKRDSSLDVAKGLLIAMLIFHHINDTRIMVGIDNNLMDYMRQIQWPLIVCYFMPAFFMISGMCSNFNKSFKHFLLNQVKSLIIPAISFFLLFHIYQGWSFHGLCMGLSQLFTDGLDYWFLIALFESKIVYYFLRKYIMSNGILLMVLLVLSFCGSLLNDINVFENLFLHRHALDLMLFVGIGNIYRDKLRSKRMGITSLIVFCVICSIFLVCGETIPYVTYLYKTTTLLWPVHVILSICGTSIVLILCHKVKDEQLLEYMGRNSLSIYLMQWYTLIMFMDCFKVSLHHAYMRESVVLIAVIFISTIAIGLLIAHITNTTKLRVLMGKF